MVEIKAFCENENLKPTIDFTLLHDQWRTEGVWRPGQ
jgi:hypothetical protein